MSITPECKECGNLIHDVMITVVLNQVFINKPEVKAYLTRLVNELHFCSTDCISDWIDKNNNFEED